MKKSARSKGTEWVCGVGRMPAYVTGEGEPYRPELLVWMLPDGPVLGFDTAKPGEILAGAAASFHRTTLHPAVGRPHTPARVRVASPELARALREALPPAVELVCAPTPEVDGMLGSMREHMGEHGTGAEPSYLAPDIGPAAVASFFRAAAGLFRARPWEAVPDDESVLSVTIESLGLRDAAMIVIGQLGESRAVLLFSGLDDLERFLEAAADVEAGEEPELPAHFAINFQRGAELPDALRKEIAEHGWEVAGADAYPWVVVVDEDMVGRPPKAKELTLAEAIALALPEALADRRAVRDAWRAGAGFRRTLRVQTHAGEVEVTVGAPYDDTGRYRPPYDVLGRLTELASAGEDVDPDEETELEEELVRRFAESPEGAALTHVDDCHYVIDLAASFMGASVATLQAAELRELLFEILPAKVTIAAAEARAIIETNRAFYAFLKREFGLPQADACLRVLGGDAVEKLEAALSDPRNFGTAKSVVQAGRAAGFDVETKEGIEAWMRDLQERPLSIGTPPLGRAPSAAPKAARAKKDKRKAARKARKKNR